MNAVLAKNVRATRELKHWTQQHLADTAGILLHTVQRVEKGDGASLESLAALSNAFDMPIDALQTDLDVCLEEMQRAEEKVKQTHDLVAVTQVTCSTHLEIVGGSDASLMQCVSGEDAAQDAFAAFKSNLTDIVDIWDDVDPTDHRQWLKSAFEQVEGLNQLGIVVCVGKAKRVLRTATGPLEIRTLYVVAWPTGDQKAFIAVERFP
jgi:transcriptional regulator with XRE-family HTH domain